MLKKARTTSYNRPDPWLLASILVLLCYGLAALYSASTVESFKHTKSTTYYIFHQLGFGVLPGLTAMFILQKVDYHLWQKKLVWLIAGAIAMLAAVKFSPLSITAGGATRWLDFGVFSFQPSELAKFSLIFYLASWADKKQGMVNDFYFGFLPSIFIVCIFSGLILLQPDFGTMLVLIGIAAVMLFASGVSWKYYFWTATAGILSLATFIHFEPYRLRRITAYLNPEADPQGISYHITQALLAIGSGGLFGYGYGLSRQKYDYLPEAMHDSIFAVTAEEQGYIRVLIILGLFAFFALRALKTAGNAPDTFGRLVCVGIGSWITIQAIINIGAMTRLLPLTGIPLPFFSYGSSAMIMNLAAMGVLLNISKKSS